MSIEVLLNHCQSSLYYQNIEDISPKEEYLNLLDNSLNDRCKYKVERSGIYTCFFNLKQALPVQGWKIHISTNIYNSQDLLLALSEVANCNEISFKFVANKYLLTLTSLKGYSRVQAGKFITVYTEDQAEFEKVIENLYEKISGYSGPYILTDHRYKDCKVLYYRYGGYQLMWADDYHKQAALITPQGDLIADQRQPEFVLPDFINDPFNFIEFDEERSYLFDNYKEITPIRFTNSGGVYQALYHDKRVILKESRPYTCLSFEDHLDSIDRRKNEVSFLQGNQDLRQLPRLLDAFFEWEHYFIAEEWIKGQTLRQFSSNRNPFMNQKHQTDKSLIETYIKDVMDLIKQILDFIIEVHHRGYILADLSLDNLLLLENRCIKMIDLESVFPINKPVKDFLTTLSSLDRLGRDISNIDYESLAWILYDLLIPRSYLKDFQTGYLRRYLMELISDMNLNPLIFKTWAMLQWANDKSNFDQVKIWMRMIVENPVTDNSKLQEAWKFDFSNSESLLVKRKRDLFELIPNFINYHLNIFPRSEYKLSFANGLSGLLYILQSIESCSNDFLEKYENWLISLYLDKPPAREGLFEGRSGIAITLLKHKFRMGEKILQSIPKPTDNSISDWSFSEGLAGVALVNLRYYLTLKKNCYLERSKELGDIFYNNKDILLDLPQIGLSKGKSGVALYLLYLYVVTENKRYLELGQQLLEKDLLSVRSIDTYQYGYPSNLADDVIYPYFCEGTAGVLAVLLRYFIITKRKDYLDWINCLAPALDVKFSVSPGYFEGIAGLGQVNLDLYYYLGENQYLNQALNNFEGLNAMEAYKDGKYLFPSQPIDKLDVGLGAGNAGIYAFYFRMDHHQFQNPLMFCDEVLKDYMNK
ncbi:MAG: class III lanthionine synthetase LanKC N-terminal domain-containing protein [Facklamia hominis]|uniref:class III lanthionine synthetase LanKC N-terminal domain-containing protein n=2 Tax=Facklamia hominis TaxID=178214 RepID=UPI0015E0E9BC|nr:lanthionine synthetase LanC family protein [Facklamia hominis]